MSAMVWHCRDCGAEGRGTTEMHCVTCHRQFGSPHSCDRHQRAGRTTYVYDDEGHVLWDEQAPMLCSDPATLRFKDGSPKFMLEERQGREVWVARTLETQGA